MRWLIVAMFVFALGMLEGHFSRAEEEMVREAELQAVLKKAELHAMILAACLNGSVVLKAEGKPVAHCKRVK